MSYPICVIGNSHAAAPKLAWSESRPAVPDDVTLTFFASKAGETSRLILDDGVLTPENDAQRTGFAQTSGTDGRIVLGDYKAFVLIALGISFVRIVDYVPGMRTIGQREWLPGGQLVSNACLRAAFAGIVEGRSAVNVLKQIRSVSAAPVIVCPQPCPAESHGEKTGDARWRPGNRYIADAFDQFRLAIDAVVTAAGGEVAWQGAESLAWPGLTKEEFHAGPIKLKQGGRDANDTVHMNRAFGRLTLEEVFRRLHLLEVGAPARAA